MAPIQLSSAKLPTEFEHVLEQIEQQFQLSDAALHAISEQLVSDFNVGLGKYGEAMAMIPTFVTGVPNGSETGTFLALDLGGTNLRVCEVQLLGDHKFTLRQQKFKVSDELKTGPVTDLFNYMAKSVEDFLTANGTDVKTETPLHLGFTFSFPVEQRALASGTLLTWTKGFSATGAVGQDIVKLFQEALDNNKVNVQCSALVNDTVGTLLTRAYLTGSCLLGAIFGTGTNGAYVEELGDVKKLYPNGELAPANSLMVINCEWGGFDNGRKILPITQWDNKVDRESINPRKQTLEKFISGMYLGEIFRNILLHLVDVPPRRTQGVTPPHDSYLLFGGHSTPVLNKHYGVDSSVLSNIEGAASLEDIRVLIAKEFGIQDSGVTERDAEIVRWASRIVTRRAGLLSGCAVGAILVQTGYAKLGGGSGPKKEDVIEVGVDGSLVEFYPNYIEAHMRDSLRVVVGEEVEKKVNIGLAKDGSGVGAALCALQASKMEKA